LNLLIALYDILEGGDAIAEDVDAITFNPIASTILKWLGFRVVRRMQYLHHSALLDNGLGLFSIAGFPWSHHMQYLADVVMETKACTLLSNKSDLKSSLA
jgi:hypothetical protein